MKLLKGKRLWSDSRLVDHVACSRCTLPGSGQRRLSVGCKDFGNVALFGGCYSLLYNALC